MKHFFVVAVLLLTSGFAAAQCPNIYSQSSQPPTTCLPYATGLFVIPLPSAGSGGPMTHLAPNSDSIAQATFQPGHQASVSGPGSADTQGNAYAYGKATDPVFKLSSCGSPGSAPYNPVGTSWHIPSGSHFSGGQSDQFFTVWDQTNNLKLSLYISHNTYPTSVTSGSSIIAVSYCTMANNATGKGYQNGNGAGDSLANAPAALLIRQNEWMQADFHGIKHALYGNGGCEASSTVFPAAGHAQTCPSNTNAPPHGSLYFLDYTDAQLNGFTGLPAWQRAILWTMAHYGLYFGDTGSSSPTSDTHPSRYESGQAYVDAGLTPPLFSWLAGQGVPVHTDGGQVYSLDYWGGVPNVVGPNCSSSTCGIAQHVHIADQCVPQGMAGVTGGCVTPPTNTPPSPPSSLTVIVQ